MQKRKLIFLFQKVLKLKIETTICGIWAGYPLLGKFRLEVYGSGKLNLGMMEWGLWNHKYRIVNDAWIYGIRDQWVGLMNQSTLSYDWQVYSPQLPSNIQFTRVIISSTL